MKNLLLKISLVATTLFLSITAMAQTITKVDVNVFPKAEKGMIKHIIEVPHSSIDEDNNKKIEFYVGKIMETDACNHYLLAGDFESKDLEGWGYNYYVFKTNGNVATTNMFCNGPSKQTFVSGKAETVAYNGRMPIVIYTPEGYEVKFKIYKAEPEVFQAAQVFQK